MKKAYAEGQPRVISANGSATPPRFFLELVHGVRDGIGRPGEPTLSLGIDIEMILEPAKEKYIARDFKEFIRISGMTHVRTSPFYPQSNERIERWHKSLKQECILPLTPVCGTEGRPQGGGPTN